jgi:terminase small subunit / prophage DNA-packing protein
LMAKVSEILTAGELAEALKVTTAAVTKWKSEGCPCRIQSGRPVYVLADVVDWRLSRAKESARPLDKDEEQIRKLKAEADRVELEVAKVRGELVPVTEFERVLAEDHDETRAALTALPSKFARLVVDRTGCTMGVAQTLLADIADATLTEMQGEGDDEG